MLLQKNLGSVKEAKNSKENVFCYILVSSFLGFFPVRKRSKKYDMHAIWA